MLEGAELMLSGKAAAYAGGAAVAGGLARYAAEGNYKPQAFVQNIVGAAVGWCFLVACTVIYPAITHEPWAFAALSFLSAYLVPSFLKIVFRRIETAEISFDGAGVEFHSKGEQKDKLP